MKPSKSKIRTVHALKSFVSHTTLALPMILVLSLSIAGCTQPAGMRTSATPISDPALSSALEASTPLPSRPTATATSLPTETAMPTQQATAISESNLERLYERYILQMDATVNDLAFSPDGVWVAAASDDGTASIYRVEDGVLEYSLRGHERPVNSVAFSPDGALLATGSSDESVRLWKVQDGSLERTITSRTLGRILSVEFSPDGGLLAVADHLCFVQLREVRTGLLRRTLAQPDCSARLGGTVSYWAMAFSPDGERILTGEGRACCGGSLQSWLVHEVQPPELIRGYNLRYRDLAYAPDGESIAVAFLGSAVFWLMDPQDGRQIHAFEGHSYRVNSVDFSYDGGLVASAGRDYKVRLWRTGDGELLRTLEAHTDEVFEVVFSQDGSLLATGGADGSVIVWDLSGQE